MSSSMGHERVNAAAEFAGLDRDKNGTVTPEELWPHDPAAFEKVDANGDGVLTFAEVMRHEMRAFQAGAGDGDGGLTFEGMVDIVQREPEGRP